MKIKNYTPHEIILFKGEKEDQIIKFPSCGIVRVASEEKVVGTIDGIPVTETSYGEVTGLPEMEEGTVLIVSRLVLTASGRPDLVVPGLQVRDYAGRVMGCKSLARS